MAARPSATTQATGEVPVRDGEAGRGVGGSSVAGCDGIGPLLARIWRRGRGIRVESVIGAAM